MTREEKKGIARRRDSDKKTEDRQVDRLDKQTDVETQMETDIGPNEKER